MFFILSIVVSSQLYIFRARARKSKFIILPPNAASLRRCYKSEINSLNIGSLVSVSTAVSK